jgi:predicted GNAT superfamily acetyltransferase
MAIVVRPVETLEQCEHFQRVEQRIWGSDEESIVPQHVLITLARNGGLVMAAWAEDGPPELEGMVGIVAGWLGAAPLPGSPPGAAARLKFCSHMAGVLPQWQRRRVGLRLKLAQYEWVRAQGLTDWMTWTYDPLQRANAVFNIHRLGATCRTYIRNLYGEMTDVLNAGGPSDRFQVDWWLGSPRVQQATARAAAQLALEDSAQGGGPLPAPQSHELQRYPGLHVTPTRAAGPFRAPVDLLPPLDGAPLALPLPDDIGAIRRSDRALALAWRAWLRGQMERAFTAGYQVVDCLHVAGHDWSYILAPDVAQPALPAGASAAHSS